MENRRVEELRKLHACLLVLPRKKAMIVQKFALWLNYRDGVGRKLNKKTMAFNGRPEL